MPRPTVLAVCALAAAATLARAATLAGLELYSDEAYYALWSLRPDWGYFDHPPMVAWIMAGVRTIWGGQPAEWALRLPFQLLGGLAVVFAALLAKELSPHPRAPVYAAALTASAPFLHLLGAMALPDAPVIAAYTASLWLIARASGPRWIAAGVVVGVALVSKYTAALLAPALLLLVLWDGDLRRQLRGPWPWLGGAIAVALFLPTLLWDARRGFVSIGFQLNHGFRDGATLRSFLEFVGAQLLGPGPVAMIAGVAALVRARTAPWKRVAVAALLPLAITIYANTRGSGEANWPAIAYPAFAAAAAALLAPSRRGPALVWGSVGLIAAVALFFGIEQHRPRLLAGSSAYQRFHGWKDFARQVRAAADAACREATPPCDPATVLVYPPHYRYAGALAWYAGFTRLGPGHGRASQLDVWGEAPRPDETFLYIGESEPGYRHFRLFVQAEEAGPLRSFEVREGPHVLRTGAVVPLRAFAGARFER